MGPAAAAGAMSRRARAILWLDAGAACLVGATTLALGAWLAELYRLPSTLVLFFALSNLAYASYSGSLAALTARHRTPSRTAIELLVFANGAWVVVCAAVLLATHGSSSVFGVAQVGLEGLFVATLAIAEWCIVRPFAR